MSSIVVVPRDVSRRAENLIVAGAPGSVLKGVEMLLQSNSHVIGSDVNPGPNDVDSSLLLKRGLDILQTRPFELLGVNAGCETVDVRKAYKKLALKYHPDKNPKTTPLFQLVQAISTKLSDSESRAKEAVVAQQKPAGRNVPPTSNFNKAPPDPRAARPDPPKPTAFPPGSNPTPGPTAPNSARSQQQQDDIKRKNYYEDLLKEQYRKAAEAERRAKEYAAKYQNAGAGAAGNAAGANAAGANANYADWQQGRKAPGAAAGGGADAGAGYYSDAGHNSYYHYGNQQPPNNNNNPQSNANANANAYNNYNYNNNKPAPPASSAAPGAAAGAYSSNAYNNAYPKYQYPNTEVPKQSAQPAAQQPAYGGGVGSQKTNNPQPQPSTASSNPTTAKPSAPAASASTATNESQQQQRKTIVPRPFGLQLVSKSSTMVELEWKTSTLHSAKLAVELSWKDYSTTYKMWEMSSKLIHTGCCRKKNLTPNTRYEFRVRAVEELPNGSLGNRSDWTESILVQLAAATDMPSANSSYANLPKPAAQPTAAAQPQPQTGSTANSNPTTNKSSNVPASSNTSNPSKPAVNINIPKPPTNPTSSNNNNTNTKTTDDLNGSDKPLKFRRFSSKFHIVTEEMPSEIFTAREKPTVPMHTEPTAPKSFDDHSISPKHTVPNPNNAGGGGFGAGLSKHPNREKTLSQSARFAWGNEQQQGDDTTATTTTATATASTNAQQSKNSNISKPSANTAAANTNNDSKGGTTSNPNTARGLKPEDPQQYNNIKKKIVTPDFEVDEEIEEEAIPVHSMDAQDHQKLPAKKATTGKATNTQHHEDTYINDFEISDDDDDEDEMESSSRSVQPGFRPTIPTAARVHPTASSSSSSSSAHVPNAPMKAAPSNTTNNTNNNHRIPKYPRRKLESPPIEIHSEDGGDGSGTESDASSVFRQKEDDRIRIPTIPTTGLSFMTSSASSSVDAEDSFEIDHEIIFFLHPPVTSDPSTATAGGATGNLSNPPTNGTGISPSKSKLNLVDSNGKVVYRYPVHAEPFPRSEVQGHLFPDKPIIACANCGDWIKVKVHMPTQKFKKTPSKKTLLKVSKSRSNISIDNNNNDTGDIWGWCLRKDKQHVYLQKKPPPSSSSIGSTSTPQKESTQSNNSTTTPGTTNSSSTPIIPTTTAAGAAGSGSKASNTTTSTPSNAKGTPTTTNSSSSSSSSSGTAATPISNKELNPNDFKTPISSNNTNANGKKTLSKYQTPTSGNGFGSTFSLNQSLRNIPLPTSNMKEKDIGTTAGTTATAGTTSGAQKVDATKKGATAVPASSSTNDTARARKPSVVYEHEEDALAAASAAASGKEGQVEEWIECYDEQGNTYYYNETTQESKWEPPEWFEETDPTTKVKYYVHVQIKKEQMVFTSTWTKPKKFARLKR